MMIRLSLGANIVALTLTEKVTLDAPVFLFEFENCQTKEKYYCIAADTSLYPERYNKFSITIVESGENPLAGQINIPTGGQFYYNVYEQEDTDNLDPENAGAIVESGMMIYDKDFDDRTEYNSNTDTRKVYEAE